MTFAPREARFWAKVDKDGPIPERRPDLGPCWIWTAAKDPRGYGRFGWEGHRTQLAHRLSYVMVVGAIPEGLTLDHLCFVTSCVNPGHLEPVTLAVNFQRAVPYLVGWQTTKTHCPQDHPYSLENTRIDVHGGRHCRICDALAGERRSAKRAAARIQKFGYDPGPRDRLLNKASRAGDTRVPLTCETAQSLLASVDV